MHGKWLQRTEKELPRATGEKSLSFGKLQRNSRTEALPGSPCNFPRQNQVMKQREPSPSVGQWGTGMPQGGSAGARAGACGAPGWFRTAWRAADPGWLLQTPSVY